MDKEQFIELATWQYKDTLLWSSTDDEGTPLDKDWSVNDVHDWSLAEQEVQDFVESNWHLVSDLEPSQVGHDFCLTRNRHGTGFWDRGLGDKGDDLTKASHAYGTQDLLVGDDDKLRVV